VGLVSALRPIRPLHVALVIASLAVFGAAACSLLVGDVRGRLVEDGGTDDAPGTDGSSDDGTSPGDATSGDATSTDAKPDAADASDATMLGDTATNTADGAADAGPDGASTGPFACDAAFATDPVNCGWCAHSCKGQTCEGGECAVQAGIGVSSVYVADDQGVLYFTSYPSASTSLYAWHGSYPPTLLVDGGENNPTHLVGRSPYLFWSTADGKVRRMLESGSAPTTLATSQNAACIGANATSVYWWDKTTGNAYSLPVDSDGGAAPTPIYTSSANATGCVAADDGHYSVLHGTSLVQKDLDSGMTVTATVSSNTNANQLLLAGPDTYLMELFTNDAGVLVHTLDHLVTGMLTPPTQVTSFLGQYNAWTLGPDGGIFWETTLHVSGCVDPLCDAGVFDYGAGLPNIYSMAADSTWIYLPVQGAAAISTYPR
jgi:hypothetical protein